MLKPYYVLCIILPLFMPACGSNQQASPDTGSLSFKLQLSRPTTTLRVAPATSADICTDYGIITINASVLNSSGATVATGSWSCSDHEGTITGVPAGSNYTVRLEGIDSSSAVTWRGEKSGIDTISEATAIAGTITMTLSRHLNSLSNIGTCLASNGEDVMDKLLRAFLVPLLALARSKHDTVFLS